ncbi:MAG: radical SAM family heme chaperone HemW, partial [Armatimonadota bacterium]
ADLIRLLDTLRDHYAVSDDLEASVEANPSDVDLATLCALRAGGVDRVSFGVQSFDDRTLHMIDRTHGAEDARRAVAAARAAGLRTWSMDLIFGLPRQTVRDWERTLDAALQLEPPHLSVYGLTIEDRTPFQARIERGRLTVPGEEAQAAMFAHALERIPSAGLNRYEISNHARPGHECRHNRMYWRNGEHFGFGAGAAGYRNGVRTVNVRRPSEYIRRVAQSPRNPFEDREQLDDDARLGETMMVGLRVTEGVDLDEMSHRFGVNVAKRYAEAIRWAVDRRLAECVDGRLRLTREGLPLASEVMARFL